MPRPVKDDPAQVKTSIRLTTEEKRLLEKLATLSTPTLGMTPNSVLRSLIRAEALRRGLVVSSAKPSTSEPLDTSVDALHHRLRRVERLYKKTVQPQILKRFFLPLPSCSKVLVELLEERGVTTNADAWLSQLRRGQGAPKPIREKVAQVLTDVEPIWMGFKKS